MRRFLTLLLLLLCLAEAGLAQEASPSPGPSSSPEVAPTAVPLAEISSQLETTTNQLRELQQGLTEDPAVSSVQSELPVLTDEVDRRQAELSQLAVSTPSLETVRTLEDQWRGLSQPLPDWRETLTNRAGQLSQEIQRLDDLKTTWSLTLHEAGEGQVPQELLVRIQSLLAEIESTRDQVEKRRGGLLILQEAVGAQDSRVREGLASIQKARAQAENRVWEQDASPLWSSQSYRESLGAMLHRLNEAISSQWTLLGSYVRTNAGSFVLHLLLFGLLTLAFTWVRQRVRPDEPALERTLLVFQSPATLALVIAVAFSGRFYPDAPPILKAWLVAIALIPTSRLLMRLIEPGLRPALTFLVAMFFVDQLRGMVAGLPVTSRLLLLLQLVVCLVFFGLRRADFATNRVARVAYQAVMGALGLAILANALGFVALGNLLGYATLQSLYLAMVLYAFLSIADGLVLLAMLVWPLNRLVVVRRHQRLLRARIHAALRFLTGLFWVLVTLENLALLRPLWRAGRSVMEATLTIGSLKLVLGDIVAFFLILWAASLVSRFVRFVLEEDVYPRLHLTRGLPYALSAVLHYSVLLIGFLMAMAALGVDTNRFTVLAGAFGVGIGFGLQNIVNNFVSGMILLFERPVKVGDTIKLGDFVGTLTRIGLRASVVHTWDGSDVIVPNGDMISNRVVNWTMSQVQRRLEIKIGVGYDSDPAEVIALLERTALEVPHIQKEPAPEALMLEFGDNALVFQLRATTVETAWTRVRSDLMVAVNHALVEAGVDLPFPQRTLHLNTKQFKPLAERMLRGQRSLGSQAESKESTAGPNS